MLPAIDMELINSFLHMVSLSGLFVCSSSPPIQLLSPTVPSICALFPPLPFPHLFLSSLLPPVTWEKGHSIAMAKKLLIQTLSLSLHGICRGPGYPSGPYRTVFHSWLLSPELLTEGEQCESRRVGSGASPELSKWIRLCDSNTAVLRDAFLILCNFIACPQGQINSCFLSPIPA